MEMQLVRERERTHSAPITCTRFHRAGAQTLCDVKKGVSISPTLAEAWRPWWVFVFHTVSLPPSCLLLAPFQTCGRSNKVSVLAGGKNQACLFFIFIFFWLLDFSTGSCIWFKNWTKTGPDNRIMSVDKMPHECIKSAFSRHRSQRSARGGV